MVSVGPQLDLDGAWMFMPKRGIGWRSWVDCEAVVFFRFNWLPPTKSRKGFALNHQTKVVIRQWCLENSHEESSADEENDSIGIDDHNSDDEPLFVQPQ